MMGLLAPMIPPASSGLQWWRWVLWFSSSGLLFCCHSHPRLAFILILGVPVVAFSTHDPTCEQLLTVGGQVLGYPGVVLGVIAVVVLLSLDHSDVAIGTHCPPCEQWLAVVGVGALLVMLGCGH